MVEFPKGFGDFAVKAIGVNAEQNKVNEEAEFFR